MKKIVSINNRKSFFIKLAIFFITVLIADVVTGKLLQKAYFNQKHGEDALTTHAITKVNKEMLVFGSSRAVNIFDPKVLEKETGLTCFNAGRIGQSIFYHHAVLKATLKRYSPEAIILSVDAWDFAKDDRDYDRLSSLLPYYNSCNEVRSTVELRSPLEKLKLVSNIYPYNSLLLPIVKGSTNSGSKDMPAANGYLSLNRVFKGPVETIDYERNKKELDTLKVNAYISFISECKMRGIKLFVVCPPYMVNPIGTNLSLKTAEAIAYVNDIPYFDFAADDYFTENKNLFADFRHLNVKGSQEFSRLISQQIKTEETNQVSMLKN